MDVIELREATNAAREKAEAAAAKVARLKAELRSAQDDEWRAFADLERLRARLVSSM